MAARRLDRVRVGQPLYRDPGDATARRSGAHAPVRRRSQLVQHRAPGMRQRRPRLLAADPDGREPARADRVSEDAVVRNVEVQGRTTVIPSATRSSSAPARRAWRPPARSARRRVSTSCSSAVTRSATPGRTCTTASCCTPRKRLSALPGLRLSRVDTALSVAPRLSRLSPPATPTRSGCRSRRNAEVASLARDDGGWIARTTTGAQIPRSRGRDRDRDRVEPAHAGHPRPRSLSRSCAPQRRVSPSGRLPRPAGAGRGGRQLGRRNLGGAGAAGAR